MPLAGALRDLYTQLLAHSSQCDGVTVPGACSQGCHGYLLVMLEQCLAALQAATILVAMASEKKFWRPKFWRKSPIGDQQIKRETYLKNDQ